MSKLPQVKPKEVIKALQRLGFGWGRTDGSHARLIHPDGRKTTISLHNEPLPKGTLKSILRQTEITIEELNKNL